MKNISGIVFLLFIFLSCQREKEINTVKQADWENRKSVITDYTGLVKGKTYLPVYSHIYHRHENHTFDLTITISIRNISITDSIYIIKADYYNTEGANIRQYLQSPIYLKPMETVEIIITEEDKEGGSGANFIFDWATKDDKNPPLFEAVMISTFDQQGLSFSTRGVPVIE